MTEPVQRCDAVRLPPRDLRGHKGTFGAVVVVGGRAGAPGEPTMIGGVCLAAQAALRAGCGLARIVVPQSLLHAALATVPEATGVAIPTDQRGALDPGAMHRFVRTLVRSETNSRTVLVVGPGLGVSDGSRALVREVAEQRDMPVVLDADAVNCLARLPKSVRGVRADAVLTPHVGEFRRLTKANAADGPPGPDAARSLAAELGSVLVLKSASTFVSDGVSVWASMSPNPVLGTAGSGDVLAGVIGALVAQHAGTLPPAPLAAAAVAAHAAAGGAWRAHHHADGGMLARDIADHIPRAIHQLRDDPAPPAPHSIESPA